MTHPAVAAVLACEDVHEATKLACKLPYNVATAADVLACKHRDVSFLLASRVPPDSATAEDVIACKHNHVAGMLAFRARYDELARHDGIPLIAVGRKETRRYATPFHGPWTAEQALAHWDGRSDEYAKLFAEAIRKDLERDR